MQMNEISALSLRKRFGEMMDRVRREKEPLIVTKNGRPMIVMMDIELYRASQENIQDEAFLEAYTEERVKEFLAEDGLDKATVAALRKDPA
ncbi:MAG: type II toxin-antitoxin system Phd/YefM family antitoxin [Candidatus Omnitrophota bacterium]